MSTGDLVASALALRDSCTPGAGEDSTAHRSFAAFLGGAPHPLAEYEDEDVSGPAADGAALPLQVVLEPRRPRHTMKFTNKEPKDSRQAKLTIFEHVEGCQVCESMFGHYQLPNGKCAHFYYDSGPVMAEMEVVLALPPNRPHTLYDLLQTHLPFTDILSRMLKYSAEEDRPIYTPAPKLCALPLQHTLRVKDPSALSAAGDFGDLDEPNMQLTVEVEPVTKMLEEERQVIIPWEEPWDINLSVFAPRRKTSDARAYFDSQQSEGRMCKVDWRRNTEKQKFVGFVGREGNPGGDKDPLQVMEELRQVIVSNYGSIVSLFNYYASIGTGGDFSMQLNEFSQFLEDCGIPDGESDYCKRSDCDTAFITANYMEDPDEASKKVNDINSLMRFEFLEVIVRIACQKYMRANTTACTDDLVVATKMLLSDNIKPNLPNLAMVDSNDFRISSKGRDAGVVRVE